jgi:hypothetical protein
MYKIYCFAKTKTMLILISINLQINLTLCIFIIKIPGQTKAGKKIKTNTKSLSAAKTQVGASAASPWFIATQGTQM